jgi:hypothetical protein
MSGTAPLASAAAAEAFSAEVQNATTPGSNITDTSNGILVGVESPVTTQSNFMTTTTSTSGGPVNPATGKTYTEEDLARVRQQEKDKLYPTIDELKGELSVLKKEREERLRAEQEAREAAEEEARKKAEAEMDLRSLLEQKEQEWNQRLEAEKNERLAAQALLEREREFQALMDYRSRRLAEEQDDIMPELLDLVEGSTPEEIEASIASLKERSARIFESAQSAMQATRRDMVGARVTAPTAGPMDTNLEQQSITADQINGMSFSEYVKNRSKLLGQRPGDRGMFS